MTHPHPPANPMANHVSNSFLSITDLGGRIGRIRWRNTQRRFPDFPYGYWGRFWWDTSWPAPEPVVSRLSWQTHEIADNATMAYVAGIAMAFRAMQPTVHEATESMRALGRAFEEVVKVPSMLLIVDEVADVSKLSPEKEKALRDDTRAFMDRMAEEGRAKAFGVTPWQEDTITERQAHQDPIRITRLLPPRETTTMARRVKNDSGELYSESVQALVTPETSQKLNEKAKRLGITRSSAGRLAIERYVESDQDEPGGTVA